MKSYELVAKTIRGENDTGVTPVYAWVFDNVTDELERTYGSVHAFEDHYKFDLAHIFGGPAPYNTSEISGLKDANVEITPEILLDLPMKDPDDSEAYNDVASALKHQREDRERFCYMQTNGIFECLNDVFGIEGHLCHLLTYEKEIAEVYRRQAEWNVRFANNIVDMGMDMIHVSDDWGCQNSLLFSPHIWRKQIYPNHKLLIEAVKKRGKFISLHSDGNINSIIDGIQELGYDLIHPYQESAGMDYRVYLDKYKDSFAIMGGVCIQTTLGFGNLARLEQEIRRVFATLKGRRWICCTTHLVQPHCTMEELEFAYDLIMNLSGKEGG